LPNFGQPFEFTGGGGFTPQQIMETVAVDLLGKFSGIGFDGKDLVRDLDEQGPY